MTARIVPDFISVATESAAAHAASRLPKALTIETTAATSFRMNPCICCALLEVVMALNPSRGVIMSSTMQTNRLQNSRITLLRRKLPKVLTQWCGSFFSSNHVTLFITPAVSASLLTARLPPSPA